MTTLLGLLGAAALFALFGYVTTRAGSRLQKHADCHGDSCSLLNECEGCGEGKDSSGWWPEKA